MRLVGKRIAAVDVADDRIVYDGVEPARFARALTGREVQAARRRGKHLWLELDERPWPTFHFGMIGGFHIHSVGEGSPRFWKLTLTMDGHALLSFTNVRRLGRIRLLVDPMREPPISQLGFDPLLDLPTSKTLRESLARRKAPIKAVLLDQRFAAGVGSWIADEVLYQARIHPARHARDLSAHDINRLRQKLRAVIRRAVEVDADSSRFPRTWLFHRRWGKQKGAATHDGHALAFDTIGGRTTAWVPGVQR